MEEIKKLAAKKECTVAQISLAWVAAQGLIAIPGTTRPDRLEENWASREVNLTPAELETMRTVVASAKPEGHRFSAMHEAAVGH